MEYWKKYHVLGAGSYGAVSLAAPVNSYLMDSNSMVAVKSGDNQRSISSLQAESNLLQELRGCPYIIQALGNDVSVEKGKMVYNLILEYASLGSLDKIIKNYRGNMPESLVAIYTYMLLKGLACLHEKEIVHCDIKPANILVFPLPESNDIGLLKIADLGLSKKVWECDGKRRCTPLYASPESVTSGLQEKAGDIWALGCTIVEMITGSPMWSCTFPHLLNYQIVHGNPKIPENISEYAKDFLGKCLNKDHNRRWTAEMLLYHPFILNHPKFSRFGIFLRNQEQVLPSKKWICSQNMFSTTSKASQSDDNVCKSTYKLFTNDKKNPFPVPCGAELMAALGSRFQAVGGHH